MHAISQNVSSALTSCARSIKAKRNYVAFWIFGLVSNVAFSISMSAAQDILERNDNRVKSNSSFHSGLGNGTVNGLALWTDSVNTTSQSDYLICNHIGTGAILTVSILTDIVVKLLFQFSGVNISYRIKVILIFVSMTSSFLTLAFGSQLWLLFGGVIFASVSIGIVELTFLPLLSLYPKNMFTPWASGSGVSSLLGSLSYAAFMSAGVTVTTYMLMMLFVPVLMAVTYAYVLTPCITDADDDEENLVLAKTKSPHLTTKTKLAIIPSLLPYLVSVGFMFIMIYFINQGQYELLYFTHQWLSREDQYRWFNAFFRIGSFISRSFAGCFTTRRLWVPNLLLFLILLIFMFQVFYRFIPYLWIVMFIVFLEGLLNGVSYVSTYRGMNTNLDPQTKEYAIGLVTIAGPIGMSVAAISSMPFHNFVCSLHLKI